MTRSSAIPCANRARNGRPVHNVWAPRPFGQIALPLGRHGMLSSPPRMHYADLRHCPILQKRDRNASRSLSPIGPDGCNKIRPRCVQPAHAASWRTPKPVFYNTTAQPLHLAACIRPHRKGRVGSKMPNCVQSPTDRAVGVQSIRSTRGAASGCAFQAQSPASIPVTRLPAESLARPFCLYNGTALCQRFSEKRTPTPTIAMATLAGKGYTHTKRMPSETYRAAAPPAQTGVRFFRYR